MISVLLLFLVKMCLKTSFLLLIMIITLHLQFIIRGVANIQHYMRNFLWLEIVAATTTDAFFYERNVYI